MLNEKQKECVDNTEGKFLVLAGPGTGKTYTITHRIKSLVQKGIPPEKILCLSFTETAANHMKEKIEEVLNFQSSNINVYTYHGFCYEIIENYPNEFELSNNFKIITESIERAFIKECIDEIQPVAFRTQKNDPYFYISKILKLIKEIKKYRLTRDQYFKNLETNPDWILKLEKYKNELKENQLTGKKITQKLLDSILSLEKKIEQAKELWKFYELYKEKMQKKRFLDFEDMISLVLDKFETDFSFLEKIANKYEYILVDEYQDTNIAQNNIVINLTKALRTENVFVVGDDDQIIYTFQGARLDTIETFLETFPETHVICLTENMRSSQNILNAARAITKQDDSRLELNPKFKKYKIIKDLTAENKKLKSNKTMVRCCKYYDEKQEYITIINEIERLINSNNCPIDENGTKNLSEIAILTRTNSELDIFAQLLQERNIPFELKDGKSIFSIKSSIALYYYMQFLVNSQLNSDKFFRLLLSKPYNINPKDYEILYNKRSLNRSFIDNIRSCDFSEFLEPEKIKKFLNTYNYLIEFKSNENLKNIILEIGSKTGIFDYYLNCEINRTENIAGLKKVIDEATAFSEVNKTTTLEDFVNYLEIALEDDIEINTDKSPFPMNAIQLSTYYSSKGREFEYVYMPTLLSEKWESDKNTFKSEIPLKEYKTEAELKAMKISDRIKILYVGMTRAKHTLKLSYVEYLNGKIKKPSIFILNILNLIENYTGNSKYNEYDYWNTSAQYLIKRDYDYKKDFNFLIDNYLKGKSFSPTAINTYLKCPRLYLYKNILKLDSKSGNADNMHFGTAIHDACEYAVNYAKQNGTYPPKYEFIEKFNNTLESLALSSYEQKKILLVRGAKALNEYYNQLCLTPICSLYEAEFDLNFNIGSEKFVGKVDRIDKNEDGTYTIYDYKTGSAKSEKVICADGEHSDYYNQIALYKYFLEKSLDIKVKETAFIFPEECCKNLFITLTDKDCITVKEKFEKAIYDIKTHNFEPIKSKENCKYCSFKTFCNFEVL